MGMTIDEALGYMPCLMEACSHCLVKGCNKPIEKIDETKLMVIETMRKYQKIEQIVNSKTTRLSYEKGFRQIKEVVEDGKID